MDVLPIAAAIMQVAGPRVAKGIDHLIPKAFDDLYERLRKALTARGASDTVSKFEADPETHKDAMKEATVAALQADPALAHSFERTLIKAKVIAKNYNEIHGNVSSITMT